MRDILRIARLQAAILRRSPSVLGTHLLALLTLLCLSAVRIAEDEADANALVIVLLLMAAAGAPMSVAAHALVAERFRGTLEALLLLPVRRSVLLAGKGVVVLAIAGAEIVCVMAFFAALGALAPTPQLLSALTSPEVLLVCFVGAPQLALLLTLIVITISGRARDAQSAANLAILLSVPVVAVFLGLWFGALAVGPQLIVVAIAGSTLLCAIAARTAAAWLTDDRLLSRRG
jgi:ABC-type Na+ efflux pump permease subunit